MTRTRPRRKPALVDDFAFLPPHEMTPVAGFHAYSHRLGAAPGEDVDVRVSGEGSVDIRIVRYGASTADVTVVDELPRAEARPRVIARGNYLYVDRVLERWSPLTVEVWVRTLADAPLSGLITQGG